jgi:tetratricopeptide (TPR) repeat protein
VGRRLEAADPCILLAAHPSDMKEEIQFFGQPDLVYRLSKGLERREQGVIFLVGAALSSPMKPEARGVLDTDGIIELIREEFAGDSSQLASFNHSLSAAGERSYQSAFFFLQGRLGQATANEIVKRAVLRARIPDAERPEAEIDVRSAPDDELRLIEFDLRWMLNPGTEALGKLITYYPKQFGKIVLTTNFDPLIEVAIRKAGGAYFKTALHADGNLAQTEGQGCHVVHLHGYWYGADTLHTVGQLQHLRPHLRASLSALLRNKIIVVCGYGGWDDVFTDALMDAVSDDVASPEILWTFHSRTPRIGQHLESRISAGISRGRVSIYAGVDCNTFFPELYETWRKVGPETKPRETGPANPVRVSVTFGLQLETNRLRQVTIQGDDEDRPPVVDLCVGRESELRQLRESGAKIVFITGIGGQGKSTLAAQYFAGAQQCHNYSHYIWRDCKEESERFENQLASVVETLSGGRISGPDLSKQDMITIVQLFMTWTADTSVLLIFDNADHYVNLETSRMTSSADILIRQLLASTTRSRVLMTCRPSINYRHESALSCHLEGISIEATRQLFAEHGALSTHAEIVDAHVATNGHAFWLDLLSIQVAKQSSLSLRDLLDKLRTEGGFLPEKTLTSIWETLSDRERLVLRLMAEAVRPETDSEIADHLRSGMNYQKVVRALNALKAMNLVVVKRRPAMTDVFELHPLVGQFIRQRFTKLERSSFIEEIIKAYRRFISSHKFQLDEYPTFTVLQYWTHTAELDIAAGRIADAISILVEAGDAFSASGYAREYCRTARLLLNSFNWVSDHGKFKAFDNLFSMHINNLSDLGEWTEAERLLEKFELTVVERNARFILYCNLRCHSKWTRGEFADAVKWGKTGQALKESSQVDTKYEVSHNLALAERDAGHPELAFPVFLNGRSLEEVLDPEELDEEEGGPHYGNIGRCLHFMGQVDSALICYQKSALLIEKTSHHHRVLNQGFIRRWVGELLLARKDFKLAGIFLEAARLKWEQASPPKAAGVAALQRQLGAQIPDHYRMSKEDIERVWLDWISGRLSEA